MHQRAFGHQAEISARINQILKEFLAEIQTENGTGGANIHQIRRLRLSRLLLVQEVRYPSPRIIRMLGDMKTTIDGGCLCGGVRYRLHEQPTHICDCHCTDCRRASGAPFITWGIVKRNMLEVLSGDVRRAPFAGRIRMFAACCGTQLFFLENEASELIDMTISSIDSPESYSPKSTIWTEDRLSWVHLDTSPPIFKQQGESGA